MNSAVFRRRALALALVGMAVAADAFADPPGPAHPAIYACRDAEGHLLTSDQPIGECLYREQRVLNRDGSLRRIIEAPLTAEQRSQRAQLQRREAEEAQSREVGRQRDRVLLSSYSNLDSLEHARKRALAESESMLEVSNLQLVTLEKEKLAIQGEYEFYKKTTPPASLAAKLEENARAREFELALMQRRNEEIARINARFDGDRARFIQLTTDAKP